MEQLVPGWDGPVQGERHLTWNLAPTALSWAIRSIDDAPAISLLKWGFGDAERGPTPFNARIETAEAKFPFRRSWKNQKCVIPADAWYEWRAEGGIKQPYHFSRKDGNSIFFGGLWTGESFTMFTKEAGGHLAEIHHRMPLSLEPEFAVRWIRGEIPTTEILLPLAVGEDAFQFHPVSRMVSNSRNDGEHLSNPL